MNDPVVAAKSVLGQPDYGVADYVKHVTRSADLSLRGADDSSLGNAAVAATFTWKGQPRYRVFDQAGTCILAGVDLWPLAFKARMASYVFVDSDGVAFAVEASLANQSPIKSGYVSAAVRDARDAVLGTCRTNDGLLVGADDRVIATWHGDDLVAEEGLDLARRFYLPGGRRLPRSEGLIRDTSQLSVIQFSAAADRTSRVLTIAGSVCQFMDKAPPLPN